MQRSPIWKSSFGTGSLMFVLVSAVWTACMAVSYTHLDVYKRQALEREADLPQLPTPPVWTDSKLRRREALKKLAMGQKLSHDTDQQQTM